MLNILGLEVNEKSKNKITFSFLSENEINSKTFVRLQEPKIIFENDSFAVVYKPSGMPTAPLKKTETNSLLYWFLQKNPIASSVCGRKKIECGLIHRLDTPTSGLVIIAKQQVSYDFFLQLQNKGKIKKYYIAIVDFDPLKTGENIIKTLNLPKKITSRFRPFGPKQKKVAPVFKNEKRFLESSEDYSTEIIYAKTYVKEEGLTLTCSLTKGYRHQIRTHLASQNLPIKQDLLYNQNCLIDDNQLKKIANHSYDLQLYAIKIEIDVNF